MTVVEENPHDENYAPLQENLERLREMKIGGRKLDILTLPMPKKMVREGLRLPASYANFYIANTCVLVPTFADANDETALSVLRECFPDRRIIGIDCRELIWGLGTFHCLTQQQPRLRRMWEGPQCPDCRGTEAAPTFSIRHWRRFVAALQNCVVQIGRMRFARIECDDHALVREIDFYICTPGIFFSTGAACAQHSSRFSPSVAISIVSRIGWSARSGKNGSAGSGSVGRAGSMVFDYLLFNVRSERSGRI